MALLSRILQSYCSNCCVQSTSFIKLMSCIEISSLEIFWLTKRLTFSFVISASLELPPRSRLIKKITLVRPWPSSCRLFVQLDKHKKESSLTMWWRDNTVRLKWSFWKKDTGILLTFGAQAVFLQKLFLNRMSISLWAQQRKTHYSMGNFASLCLQQCRMSLQAKTSWRWFLKCLGKSISKIWVLLQSLLWRSTFWNKTRNREN